MLRHPLAGIFYRNRIVLLVPLVFLLIQYSSDMPTRLFVRSALFYLTLALLAAYSSLTIYLFAECCKRILTLLCGILPPIIFIPLSHSRYDGGVNTEYATAFDIVSVLILAQLAVWIASLFLKIPSVFEEANSRADSNTLIPGRTHGTREDISDAGDITAKAVLKLRGRTEEIKEIHEKKECFFVVDMYGGSSVIDFSRQYEEYTETLSNSTQSYTAVCSYLKFGEYLQERVEYTVTLMPPDRSKSA